VSQRGPGNGSLKAHLAFYVLFSGPRSQARRIPRVIVFGVEATLTASHQGVQEV
jgi:hypothetical protein